MRDRFYKALIACLMAASFGFGAANAASFNDALRAAERGNWTEVEALRAGLAGPELNMIDWMRLRGQQGTFAECQRFVTAFGDWPGMPLLRRRCENTIPRGADPDRVLQFFKGTQPQTGTGSLRYAEALYRTGQNSAGSNELRRAWMTFAMTQSEHDAYVTRNGNTVKDQHVQRLDMLVWRGAHSEAERMFDLVSDDYVKLAKARIALRKNEKGVDTLIEAVPESLRDDAGLAYERFLWRLRRDRDEAAVEILMERSISALDLGRPSAWAKQRRALARDYMRSGKAEQAYAIASSHYMKGGSDYADLEWLSGFLALRQLEAPAEAVAHFERFGAAVATPISLGRAGYWLGRAHEALGDDAAAAEAYAQGAQYQSSFYGQLAAERAGLPADPNMTGQGIFPSWRQASFANSSILDAILALHEAGHRNLTERFMLHAVEGSDRVALGQMADLALELEEPHIALMVSKLAARQGYELYRTYFPIATPAGLDLPVSPEFALSIARRESEFDPVVVSSAGARGLMQLMPRTAQEVARQVGESYSSTRLLSDPVYNARLGSQYLANLSRRFGNNPVLMSIAYNAGPSRANRWMSELGDPRSDRVDVVDWIEYIPFSETRNYVMRVTESFAPYRARLSGRVEDPALTSVLKQ
ncbi:lytic transglycosylase domain-containing protein [Litoreibacter roseus]|uniref:Lytic transglycosylase n=1 Tax=Litoreibacter roseus TaxID=2601869 RepID=A0A6N6JG96_9RHOB|nr:lytic transglycosylase domain-containing protein [Litoreibacter roseus]GFE64987.1 lytic transglycosylase [Litoreibacter roseus]